MKLLRDLVHGIFAYPGCAARPWLWSETPSAWTTAKRSHSKAQGRRLGGAPWEIDTPRSHYAEGVTHYRVGSIPHIPFIDLDAIFSAEATKFVLKRFVSVVLLLVEDVFFERLEMRGAHGKCTVALLPVEIGKFWILFFDPLRRVAFEFTNQRGDIKALR